MTATTPAIRALLAEVVDRICVCPRRAKSDAVACDCPCDVCRKYAEDWHFACRHGIAGLCIDCAQEAR